jgi:hypothetical protein
VNVLPGCEHDCLRFLRRPLFRQGDSPALAPAASDPLREGWGQGMDSPVKPWNDVH